MASVIMGKVKESRMLRMYKKRFERERAVYTQQESSKFY